MEMNLSRHVSKRMAQRSIRQVDVSLIQQLGTPKFVNGSIHWILNKKACALILDQIDQAIQSTITGQDCVA